MEDKKDNKKMTTGEVIQALVILAVSAYSVYLGVTMFID